MERFERDLREPCFKATVARDVVEARAIGATTTPTVFLNGLRFDGIQALAEYVAANAGPPAQGK